MNSRKRRNIRVAVVGTIFMLWLAAIGARAGYLQLYRGEWLSSQAVGQVEKTMVLHGKRGTIYDIRHQPMAVSIETPSVAINPAVVNQPQKAASKLARALNLKSGAVAKKLSSSRHFVWLKRQATPKEAAAVKALNIEGVDFLPEHSRFYPNTTLAAQVLGFTGIDGHGLEGLEFFYDRALKGSSQEVTVFKDALGRGFDSDRFMALHKTGNNLVLTLDGHIQYIAEQALASAVTSHKAKSGMAVVMDPASGAILAMAHYPFFNPNNYRKFNRDRWRNRIITDPFEPGSTLKIFSAAAALESGRSTPSTIFFCENGNYLVGDHTVHDTKSHGWLSLQQIVKYSSNIGAVKVVERIGAKALYDHLRGFGFGARTAIDCPGESAGALSHYKRWTAVDAGAIAFGQGISVTGLQMITAVAALANDGLMMRPHIVQAITDTNGRPIRNVSPVPVSQVVSTNTARSIRRIMRTVITPGGTGVKAELDGYSVCGKTGTAQKIGKNGTYAADAYVASFVGFAPTERPAIAALVVVDEPRGNHYGGLVAAPAFKTIIKETLSYMNIAPGNDMKRLQVLRDVKVNG